MLKEIRLHGRGGQGVVTLGELIAIAAFYDGKEVKAFPSFGVERQGAPVESFIRISDEIITRRDQIRNPDFLVILDDTLLSDPVIYGGLDKGDIVLVNTRKTEDEVKRIFKNYPDITIKVMDATSLGIKIIGKPFPNTGMLAAFASATEMIKMSSIKKAVEEKFGYKGRDVVDKNLEIVKQAYEHANPRAKLLLAPGKRATVPYEKERYRVAG